MGYDIVMEDTVCIKINNISKKYISDNKELEVISNLSLNINKGEFVSILGKSGSGKSTLLRSIGGFEQVNQGEIFINQNRIINPGVHAAMVFQDFNQIFPWKTVFENVCYPVKINNMERNDLELKEHVDYYLNLVGLSNFANYFPHQLSGGMKQRVALARSLALEPSVILMDEPFASLDADTRNLLRKELINIWNKVENHVTILFVTHNIHEAISMGTKFLVIISPNDIRYFDNTVEGERGVAKSPENKGFNECWSLLNNMIRGN